MNVRKRSSMSGRNDGHEIGRCSVEGIYSIYMMNVEAKWTRRKGSRGNKGWKLDKKVQLGKCV